MSVAVLREAQTNFGPIRLIFRAKDTVAQEMC
jgi:hypothetical protein